MKHPSDTAAAPTQERILVIRLSSLGDVLLAAPALRALRGRFPEAHIDLLVAKEYADAARLMPGPTRVLEFDRREGLRGLLKWCKNLSRRYSILVDLQNSARSSLLRHFTFPTFWVRAERYRLARGLLIRFKWNRYRGVRPVPLRYLEALEMFGVRDDGRGLELQVPTESNEWAARTTNGRKFSVLCPGARHFTKRWPAEKWVDTGRALNEQGTAVFIVGGEEERVLIEAVAREIPSAVAVIQESLSHLAALFQQATTVISNDSGLMHLAGGVGAPVVGIFGPTVEAFGFYPFRARSAVVSRDLPCRPCSAMGTEKCPLKHFKCMLDLQPDEVLQATEQLVKRG